MLTYTPGLGMLSPVRWSPAPPLTIGGGGGGQR